MKEFAVLMLAALALAAAFAAGRLSNGEAAQLRAALEQARHAQAIARAVAETERDRAARAAEIIAQIREGGYDAPLPDDLRDLLAADRLRGADRAP